MTSRRAKLGELMEELKQRIKAEGQNLGDGILKIDSLLNHQIDVGLIMRCGEELARRFANAGVTRILTAEVSGIAPAFATAYVMGVPLIYARKVKPVTMYGPVYLETAPSHTKGMDVQLLVSAEFLPGEDRILIVDDFLASGKTLRSLARMVRSAKSELVGIACVVEKSFEGGRKALEHYNVPIEALATIISMDNGQIVFLDETITK
ncbi:MAG: xanthine phosphoribosyltransferase [Chloroflexota bacterium]